MSDYTVAWLNGWGWGVAMAVMAPVAWCLIKVAGLILYRAWSAAKGRG